MRIVLVKDTYNIFDPSEYKRAHNISKSINIPTINKSYRHQNNKIHNRTHTNIFSTGHLFPKTTNF